MRRQERDDDDDQHGINGSQHGNSHRRQEGDDHEEVVDYQEGLHEKEEFGDRGIAVPVRISFRIAVTIAGWLIRVPRRSWSPRRRFAAC
jgi:hypothetical protein